MGTLIELFAMVGFLAGVVLGELRDQAEAGREAADMMTLGNAKDLFETKGALHKRKAIADSIHLIWATYAVGSGLRQQ